ncbi:MAG: hypothetical protein ACKVS8_11280 [Phycisphaerales bacterium]
MDALEGCRNSRTRREQWTLGQTGKWLLRLRDLDGDGAWGGTDELNDTGTFNVANEWPTSHADSPGREPASPDLWVDLVYRHRR